MTEPLSSFDVLPRAGAQVYRSARGTTYTWHPAPGIFVTRIEGFAASDTLTAIEVGSRRAATAGVKLTTFHDWWEVTDYVPETRTRLATLRRELDHATERSNILFRSKLVAFGVRSASLMLRDVYAFSERAPFERALHERLQAAAIASSNAPRP